MPNKWRTINSLVHKIRLHGRRGKETAESFLRKKFGQAPQKEGGEVLCVIFFLCNPGWYVHQPDVQNKWDDNTHYEFGSSSTSSSPDKCSTQLLHQVIPAIFKTTADLIDCYNQNNKRFSRTIRDDGPKCHKSIVSLGQWYFHAKQVIS